MRLTRKFTASLSARRRSRFAGPAVLLAGLLATGALAFGISATVGTATAAEDAADAATIAKGKALFLVGCSSCHGKNGEGIMTDRGTQYGPPLAGVGAAAVDFQVGTGRMPMVQPGTQAPRKKPVYNDEEIAAMAAYVQSLAPGPAIPEPEKYDVSEATNEDRVEGARFFRTNCTACHNFAGTGGALPHGRFAPTLMGVDAKHIYEAMLTGPQQMPGFSDKVLSPDDKRQIIAYLKALEEEPAYGGFTLGSMGPVSEGMFVWIVGIGGAVLMTIWITSATARTRKNAAAATEGDEG